MKKTAIILILITVSTSLYSQFFQSAEVPEVDVTISISHEEIEPGDSFTITATYTIPEHYHMFLNEELFNIYINDPMFLPLETIYPLDESEELLGIPSFSEEVTISRTFQVREDMIFQKNEIEIIASYQICDDFGTCLLPEEVVFNQSLTINSSGSSTLSTLLWFFLLAFAGGIILNVMPCVLPLLSVKALNLVEQSHHDRKTIITSSLMYALGIWVSFITLAVIVILLKNSGEIFGWGFQFQNPLFVLVLLTVIFVFSLSLFDVFTLNAPQKGVQQASKYSAGKSYSSSFFTGIFAVLVATPCTAPFMGAALGFAFSQSSPVIIVIFTALSIGFALPFVLLGLFPKLIKKIPKPGKWMNTFKEFMGFLLLGTVVYMLTSLYSLIGDSIKGVLWFLLFTGLSIWLFGRFASPIEKLPKRILIIILSLLIISFSSYFFVDLSLRTTDSTQKLQDSHWQVFSSELVEKYRSEGTTVFIDFYADWCTSCKVNDAAVLDRQQTLDLFEQYNVELLKGDFTAGDKEIARWLSQYQRAGVPLYLLFRPGEEAVIFPEFLSISMIEKELELIRP